MQDANHFNRLFEVLNHVNRTYNGKLGLSHLILMSCIASNEVTQFELEALTGIPRANISRDLSRLEDNGFLTKERDGKRNQVAMTSKGKALMAKIILTLYPTKEATA